MDRDTLYRDYMTIVFGLVATKGLEQLAGTDGGGRRGTGTAGDGTAGDRREVSLP